MTGDLVRDQLVALARRAPDLDPTTLRIAASEIIGDRLPLQFTDRMRDTYSSALDELVAAVRDLRLLADGMLDPLTYVDDGWAGPDAKDYARHVLESQRDQALTRLGGGGR